MIIKPIFLLENSQLKKKSKLEELKEDGFTPSDWGSRQLKKAQSYTDYRDTDFWYLIFSLNMLSQPRKYGIHKIPPRGPRDH